MTNQNSKLSCGGRETQGQKLEGLEIAVVMLICTLLSVPGILLMYFNQWPLPRILDPIAILLMLISEVGPIACLCFGIVFVIRYRKSKAESKATGIVICAVLASIIELGAIGAILLPRIRSISPSMVCGSNLSGLGKAMLIYANDYDEKYPTPDKWCDLLIQHGDLTEQPFRCLGNKKERCSYAMNPNCEPNSPQDMVLLFETRGAGIGLVGQG